MNQHKISRYMLRAPIPQEVKNNGSESFTTGKRLIFPRYTTCETILRMDSLKGKPSTRQSRTCRPMTKYMRRVSSFLASTVCSSTSSER
jgi:hypothetical protein